MARAAGTLWWVRRCTKGKGPGKFLVDVSLLGEEGRYERGGYLHSQGVYIAMNRSPWTRTETWVAKLVSSRIVSSISIDRRRWLERVSAMRKVSGHAVPLSGTTSQLYSRLEGGLPFIAGRTLVLGLLFKFDR